MCASWRNWSAARSSKCTYKTIFDAWEDGGVTGIVVGRMRFVESDGSSKRAFAPDPKVFESFGVSPPEPEAYDAEREKVLHQILDDAAGRGWRILFFALLGGGGNRPREEDPFGETGLAAKAHAMVQLLEEEWGMRRNKWGLAPFAASDHLDSEEAIADGVCFHRCFPLRHHRQLRRSAGPGLLPDEANNGNKVAY